MEKQKNKVVLKSIMHWKYENLKKKEFKPTYASVCINYSPFKKKKKKSEYITIDTQWYPQFFSL